MSGWVGGVHARVSARPLRGDSPRLALDTGAACTVHCTLSQKRRRTQHRRSEPTRGSEVAATASTVSPGTPAGAKQARLQPVPAPAQCAGPAGSSEQAGRNQRAHGRGAGGNAGAGARGSANGADHAHSGSDGAHTHTPAPCAASHGRPHAANTCACALVGCHPGLAYAGTSHDTSVRAAARAVRPVALGGGGRVRYPLLRQGARSPALQSCRVIGLPLLTERLCATADAGCVRGCGWRHASKS